MSFKTIIKLADVKTLVAGLIPVIFASVYSYYAYERFNLFYFVLIIISIVLTQSATNMINDYFDFKRGADDKDKQDEKALVSGEASKFQVKLLIAIFLIISILTAIYFSVKVSPYILLIAIIGVMISFLYAAGPRPISYMPIGEIVSGITMGVGITSTVIFIHSGEFNLSTVLIAIPTSLYIATILLSNNLSDIEPDKAAGRKTLPILVGVKNSENLWILNILTLYGLILIFYIINILPVYSLLALIFIPYKSIKSFKTYDKNIHTKGRTMGIIAKIGLNFHVFIIFGLIISVIIK